MKGDKKQLDVKPQTQLAMWTIGPVQKLQQEWGGGQILPHISEQTSQGTVPQSLAIGEPIPSLGVWPR